MEFPASTRNVEQLDSSLAATTIFADCDEKRWNHEQEDHLVPTALEYASGHSDQPSDTNVRKLYLLTADDPSQLKYYDSGVGTDGAPLSTSSAGDGKVKMQDGYEFLSFVKPGDQIFIFGFSRGAYTARSLAGMIALFGARRRISTIEL